MASKKPISIHIQLPQAPLNVDFLTVSLQRLLDYFHTDLAITYENSTTLSESPEILICLDPSQKNSIEQKYSLVQNQGSEASQVPLIISDLSVGLSPSRRVLVLSHHKDIWFQAISQEILRLQNSGTKSRYDNYQASLLIPVWNKVELTKQCVEALDKTIAHLSAEVILVDNASTDETAQYLSSLKNRPNYTIIQNSQNLGFAKATNQAARIAQGTYLVLLNNDTVPQPQWLDALLETIENQEQVGIVGSKMFYADERIQHAGASMRFDKKFFRHQYKFLHRTHPLINRERQLDAVTAACFLTPRALYLELGLLDEKYLNGSEDMDYCMKVKQAGLKTIYQPKSELFHLESQTPRPVNKDDANFEYFIQKWGEDAMQTEIEVYTQDGFWKTSLRDLSLLVPETLSACEPKLESNPPLRPEVRAETLKRIYPVSEYRLPATTGLQTPAPPNPVIQNARLQNTTTPKTASQNPAPQNFTAQHPTPAHSTVGTTQASSPIHKPKYTSVPNPQKPMRILFVCHDFPPYKYAGAQVFAMNLAKAMNKIPGVVVEILHPTIRGESDKFELNSATFEGLQIYRMNKDIKWFGPDYFSHPAVADMMEQFLNVRSYDMVHVHTLGQLSLAPLEVVRKRNIPVITTLHEFWYLCSTWHNLNYKNEYCEGPESAQKCGDCYHKFLNAGQAGLKVSDLVSFEEKRHIAMMEGFKLFDLRVAPSKFLIRKYDQFGFENISYVGNGLEYPKPLPKVPSPKIRIGFVARVIARKGPHFLVEAFKKYHLPNLELRIYGASDEAKYIQNVIDASNQYENIMYCGPYEIKQIPQIYSEIDLAAIPSIMDNAPLAVQEAHAQGVPAIGTRVGGIPEMIDEGVNGELFDLYNVDQIGQILTKISQNPQIVETWRQNIPHVKTLDENAVEYLGIYKDVIETLY